jgi:hypothetical protein
VQFALIGYANDPVLEIGKGFFQQGRSLGCLFRFYVLGEQLPLDGKDLWRERSGAAFLVSKMFQHGFGDFVIYHREHGENGVFYFSVSSVFSVVRSPINSCSVVWLMD